MKLLFISAATLLSFTISFWSNIQDAIIHSQNENAALFEVNRLVVNSVDTLHYNELVLVPKSDDLLELNPILSKDFVGFKEAIGFRESAGHYNIISKTGYIGKYQFGKYALHDLRINDRDKFLKSAEYQEKAFVALCSINKYRLRNYLSKFSGQEIGGIVLTESGMLAASHLLGPGAVIKFINSKGVIIKKDGLGTSIREYLTKFSGYDTSVITPSSWVKIDI